MFFSKFKEDLVQFPSQKKSNPKLPSRRPSHASKRPLVPKVQVAFRPDVLATRPDSFKSSRRIQHLSASFLMTWQYRPDSSQCLTSKRISFVDIDMGRQLQSSGLQVYSIQMLSLIRQDVKKNCNRLDVKATPGRQSFLWKLRVAEVQPFGHQGNTVQT